MVRDVGVIFMARSCHPKYLHHLVPEVVDHFYRDASELAEFAGVRLVVKRAGDQDVETDIAGLARGLDEVGPLHRPKLWPDEDGGPFFDVPLAIAPFRAHHLAGPRRERLKGDP